MDNYTKYAEKLDLSLSEPSGPTAPIAEFKGLCTNLFEEVLAHLPMQDLLVLQRVSKFWKNTINVAPRLQEKLFYKPSSYTLLEDAAGTGMQQVRGEDRAVAPCGNAVTLNPMFDLIFPKLLFGDEQVAGPWNELFSENWVETIADRDQRMLRTPGGVNLCRVNQRMIMHVTINSRLGGLRTQQSVKSKRETLWKGQSWERMLLTQPPLPRVAYISGRLNYGQLTLHSFITGANTSGNLRSLNGVTLGKVSAFMRRINTHLFAGHGELMLLQLNLGNVEVINTLGPLRPRFKQEALKVVQAVETPGAPKTPKLPPQTPQLAPTTPQRAPTSPQLAPTTPQLAPTTPQLAPTTPQLAPNTPELAPNTPKLAPNTPEPVRNPPLTEDDISALLGPPIEMQKPADVQWDWNKHMRDRAMTREDIVAFNDSRVLKRQPPIMCNAEKGYFVADEALVTSLAELTYRVDLGPDGFYRHDLEPDEYLLSREGFENFKRLGTDFAASRPVYNSFYTEEEKDVYPEPHDWDLRDPDGLYLR